MRTLAKSPWRLPAILFAVVFLCYLPGLWNGFLWIDHSEIVQGVARVVGLEDLPQAFLSADNSAGYHRPMYRLIHTLDHAIWGLQPAGYYLSSAVLHALNVALLFVLLRRCRSGVGAAFVVATVWGLHPVNTAVAGLIHAKADVFGLTCILVSLLAFVRLGEAGGRARTWVVGLVAFVMGALTKESVFLLPIVLATYVSVARPPGRWAFVVTMGAIALALGVLHLTATSGIETRPAELAFGQRVFTFLGVYLEYIGLLLCPIGLSMSDAVTPFSAQTTIVQTMIVIGSGVVAGGQIFAWLKWPALRKWLFLFNLTLLPVSQLLPILHFRADRYLYLPSLAFVGALVEAALILRASRLGDGPTDDQHRRTITVLCAVVLAAFTVRIVVRLQLFRDDLTLFSAEVDHDPGYREGLSHLGRAYERIRQLGAAERCYRAALVPWRGRVSYFDRDALLINLTHNLAAQGRQADAFEFAAANIGSMQTESHRLELLYNQAVAAYNLGRFPVALPLLQEYGRQRPRDAVCLFLIGATAAKVGDGQLARECLRRYLQLRHGDERRDRDARRILESL